MNSGTANPTFKLAILSVGTLLLSLVLYAPSAAQVPTIMNYQGRLSDNTPSQNPVTATLPMEFRIFGSSEGADLLWSETWAAVDVVDGIFSLLLGSNGNPILPSVFSGGATPYLELEINGEIALPRKPLGTVGFSYQAETSLNVECTGCVDGVDLLDASIGADDIATGAVGTAEILDGTIQASDIATGAVNSNHIASNAVGELEIQTGAVGSSEVASNSLTAADLATGSVGTSEILNGTIQASDIATSAVRSAEVQNSSLLAVDLGDEPGIDFVGGSHTVSLPVDDSPVLVRTVTLSIPASGYVFAIATGWIAQSGNISNARCSITTGTTVETAYQVIAGQSLAPGQANIDVFAVNRVFSVAAGSFTVNLVCRTIGSTEPTVNNSYLSAIYLPTRY